MHLSPHLLPVLEHGDGGQLPGEGRRVDVHGLANLGVATNVQLGMEQELVETRRWCMALAATLPHLSKSEVGQVVLGAEFGEGGGEVDGGGRPRRVETHQPGHLEEEKD